MKKTFIGIGAVIGISLFAADVKLSWDPLPVADQVTGYVVYERAGSSTNRIGSVLGSVTNFTHTGVVPGVHNYVITGTNEWLLEGAFSDPVSTPATGTKVTGLTRTIAGGNVTLNWTASPANQQVDGYHVFEQVGANLNVIAQTASTTYTVVSPSAGPHTYVVASTNYWGAAPASDPVSTPPVPGKVGGVRINR